MTAVNSESTSESGCSLANRREGPAVPRPKTSSQELTALAAGNAVRSLCRFRSVRREPRSIERLSAASSRSIARKARVRAEIGPNDDRQALFLQYTAFESWGDSAALMRLRATHASLVAQSEVRVPSLSVPLTRQIFPGSAVTALRNLDRGLVMSRIRSVGAVIAVLGESLPTIGDVGDKYAT